MKNEKQVVPFHEADFGDLVAVPKKYKSWCRTFSNGSSVEVKRSLDEGNTQYGFIFIRPTVDGKLSELKFSLTVEALNAVIAGLNAVNIPDKIEGES